MESEDLLPTVWILVNVPMVSICELRCWRSVSLVRPGCPAWTRLLIWPVLLQASVPDTARGSLILQSEPVDDVTLLGDITS